MKKIVSILFLSLMLLQAIPVLHFFSAQKEIFYALIDEEKPQEKAAEKKECRQAASLLMVSPAEKTIKIFFPLLGCGSYNSPLLELQTPPPDAC